MSIDPTQPVAVEARGGLRIWIRFQDGEEGEIDLSDLAGMGVFKAWEDRGSIDITKSLGERRSTFVRMCCICNLPANRLMRFCRGFLP